MEAAQLAERAETVRRFNRFYTRQIGVLHEHLLNSEFSLTEVRILYELAHRAGLTTADLVSELSLNAGYLSRIITRFEKRGLIKKTRSETDARASLLALTRQGRASFEPLNKASHQEVAAMLEQLSQAEQQQLVVAMHQIEGLLDKRGTSYLLRDPQAGDMGWVIHRHGALYAQEYGWNADFEALVAEVVAKYIRDFDPSWERSWIAEKDGAVVGSVFLVRHTADVAKLRLLYVEPSARGLGIGKRLVQECIRHAKQLGYKKLILWTNSILVGARGIYQNEGFKLTGEEPHHSFGKDLVGETWELLL
ncbi:bifunctional helix-turn-helix transcriptional regulator/GNAT family N-acetyltransferase [Paralcaligenes ureilyticus]|uniref:DNA-binding MarR family transcriptional regulator n=1 Tax=Paralcaligenes ureilyticus TaxID=627131 RepID=A0A4R3LSE8_9BURK|nr:GNAT family N-acetyltransferase [Paralcaligenes ureilyticus]TCT01117.1 DNA-binding MarR family transcriptional regulator [Paralcaligenes ureilyticus]